MSDDRDRATEQRLRDALAAAADAVQPEGDGLMRIQQRIGARRTRDRWLRPALALGSVVVIAAVAVGGVAIARHDSNGKAVVNVGKSPGTSTPPPAATFPSAAFFPFTTAAEEASWEQSFAGGHSPWISDPVGVAEAWLQNYLKQGSDITGTAKAVEGGSADVTMSRPVGGTSHPVAIVHLVKYRNAWLVTGASAPDGQLVIASPAPGATVTSPVTVSGPGFGVDERALVQIRDAETPALLGEARTGMFGNGTAAWSASVPFAPSKDGFGVIVVSVASPADGGLGELTAQKAAFGQASPAPTGASSFYGVQNGHIEKFSAGGAPQGPVAGADSYGTVTEVKQVGGRLYFTARQHGCDVDTVNLIPAGGGSAASTVTTSAPGYQITGFDISPDGTEVAYFETGCGRHAGTAQLVVDHLASRHTHTVDFPSMPPVIVGDPVWEADGVHLDAFVRTGNLGYLARYDAAQGNQTTPTALACSGYDANNGLPGALGTAPDGTLFFAVQTGSSMQVISCAGGTPRVRLTVPGDNTPVSVSVDSAGDILLADAAGQVWIGKPDGSQTAVAGVALTSVTW